MVKTVCRKSHSGLLILEYQDNIFIMSNGDARSSDSWLSSYCRQLQRSRYLYVDQTALVKSGYGPCATVKDGVLAVTTVDYESKMILTGPRYSQPLALSTCADQASCIKPAHPLQCHSRALNQCPICQRHIVNADRSLRRRKREPIVFTGWRLHQTKITKNKL